MARLGRSRPNRRPRNVLAAIAPVSSTVTGAAVNTTANSTSAATGSTVTGTSARTTANATSAATGTAATSTTYILNDDFPGSSIDTSQWVVYNRLGDQANSEVNAVIPANVVVTGGELQITSKFEDVTASDLTHGPTLVHYTSGQIAQKATPFLYGQVDVRAKLPGGTGTWPDIWMLGYGWQATQPFDADYMATFPVSAFCEIDIAEFLSNVRTSVNCQIHYDPGTGQVNPGGVVGLPSSYDATSRFMVYRLVWAPGSAIFSVDPEDGSGFQVVQTITGGGNVPNVAMYLIIHTAVGGIGGGTPNSSTFPQTMHVDYARVAMTSDSINNGAAANTTANAVSAASGSSVTGTSARTTANATSAASGTASPPGSSGTIATTTAAATSAASGSTVTGTSARTTASATSTATGAHGAAKTAQVATLALTGVQGTSSTGAVSTAAQVASISMAAIQGVSTIAGGTVAQPSMLALSGVQGASTTGPATTTAQVASISLTAAQGVSRVVGATIAQPATITLTAVPGVSTGSQASTVAQPATVTIVAVQGVSTTGPTTTTAQVASISLTAVGGTSARGPMSTVAQVGGLTLVAVAGTALAGAVTKTAQVATITLTAIPGAGPQTGTPPVICGKLCVTLNDPPRVIESMTTPRTISYVDCC